MEIFKGYATELAFSLILAAITAISGYLGVKFKNLYQKHIDTETKQAVAKTCVSAVEQIYTDLHGEEKYQAAMGHMVELLSERGIKVSETEIVMLIEAAVGEFNRART